MPGKRVHFDDETWQALDLLGRDSMKEFQELADEAFRDLLRKHDRPVGLKAALRRSAGISNVTQFSTKREGKSKKNVPGRNKPKSSKTR
jgi:hypothetical protein